LSDLIEDWSGWLYRQPTKMEEVMELILAQMDSFQEKIEVNQEEMRTNGEKFEAPLGTLVSRMDIHEANQREMIAKMNAWIEGTEACVGKLETSRGKSNSGTEHQDVPKEGPQWKLLGHRRTGVGTGI
jgi:hypothetical protein